MTLLFDNKQIIDKKQTLCEIAFCHFPVLIVVDGKDVCFDTFSEVEAFLNCVQH